MGAVPLRLARIKKHQSFFKPWCKRFYALHTAPLGKPRVEIGTEYPDLVRGAKAPFFPQSLPRFHPSDRAAALSEKTYTLQCRFCVGDSHPVSLCSAPQRKAVFLNMPIFICKFIMNLFVHFVNIFTQKIARMEACRTVLILSTHFCFRAHGALAKRDL